MHSKSHSQMKFVHMESLDEDAEVFENSPIPDLPEGCARVRVCYAGVCYTENQMLNCGHNRSRLPGINDTSLFPGYEVSGILESICPTIKNCPHKIGERVIIFPDNQDILKTGYSEYVIIRDVNNLVTVPPSIPLEVAALLPSGALKAYSAQQRAHELVMERVSTLAHRKPNILIVGAGGLGLWVLSVVKQLNVTPDGQGQLCNIVIADTNVEKLMVAKNEIGCHQIVHWNDSVYEETLLDRTKTACPEGVDVVIDFVSSPRTIKRALKVMNEGGCLIAGGNSNHTFTFDMHRLAQSQISIVGVNRGTREQLKELVELVAQKKIVPPCYDIFPVEEVNQAYRQLRRCSLKGRAVLKLSDSGDTPTAC